jgi:hypothetical protein
MGGSGCGGGVCGREIRVVWIVPEGLLRLPLLRLPLLGAAASSSASCGAIGTSSSAPPFRAAVSTRCIPDLQLKMVDE